LRDKKVVKQQQTPSTFLQHT